jgi:sulfur-oxidizing protein SoxY
MKRRTFLQGSLAGSALAVAVGAGLLKPGRALAAAWPEAAFTAKAPADSVKAVFGAGDAADSKDITITAPLQAENGAVVPVKVETKLPAQKIAIVAEKNPTPLITALDLSGGALGYYSVRIKMGATSNVVAYVQSGGKLYKAAQEVKVTVGGCGG